jgi:hypothetical protein
MNKSAKICYDIYKWTIDELKQYSKRKSKIKDIAPIIFKLLCTQSNVTQQSITNEINYQKKTKIDRSSYIKHEKKIDLAFYNKLLKYVISLKKKYFHKDDKQIIAVDGTHSNLLGKLSTEGYKLDKYKQEYVRTLVMGIYNVTTKTPLGLDMVNHTNERLAFTDFVSNNDILTNQICVFDRGFFSYELLQTLEDANINYVFRINKTHNKLISINKDDTKIINHNNKKYKIRMINYKIGDNQYNLLTNLVNIKDYSIDKLKEIYHLRWTIEEYFKLIKDKLTLRHFKEYKKENILKSLYSQLIVTNIMYIFETEQEETVLKMSKYKKQVNRKSLLDGTFKILINMLNRNTLKTLTSKICTILIIYVNVYVVKDNRVFKRIGKDPNSRWHSMRCLKRCDEKLKETKLIDINKKTKIQDINKEVNKGNYK